MHLLCRYETVMKTLAASIVQVCAVSTHGMANDPQFSRSYLAGAAALMQLQGSLRERYSLEVQVRLSTGSLHDESMLGSTEGRAGHFEDSCCESERSHVSLRLPCPPWCNRDLKHTLTRSSSLADAARWYMNLRANSLGSVIQPLILLCARSRPSSGTRS